VSSASCDVQLTVAGKPKTNVKSKNRVVCLSSDKRLGRFGIPDSRCGILWVKLVESPRVAMHNIYVTSVSDLDTVILRSGIKPPVQFNYYSLLHHMSICKINPLSPNDL
jgi:hypothetical protein